MIESFSEGRSVSLAHDRAAELGAWGTAQVVRDPEFAPGRRAWLVVGPMSTRSLLCLPSLPSELTVTWPEGSVVLAPRRGAWWKEETCEMPGGTAIMGRK